MSWRAALAIAALGTPAWAQVDHAGHGAAAPDPHAGHAPAPADPHAGHDMSAMGHGAPPAEGPAESAEPPPAPRDHAADRYFAPATMAAARARLTAEHGGTPAWQVMLDMAEARLGEGADGYAWRGEAWMGGALHRAVLKTEGEGRSGEGAEEAEVQALYSRAASPYFDLQAGVRHDISPNPSRTYAVIGLEGLAPYGVELTAASFLSDHGELSARLEGAFDLRLTQRLVLQPRAEIDLAASDVAELGVGAGVSRAEYGLRLRYHLSRELAPYLGVVHRATYGETRDLARAAGEEPEATLLVLGLRAWF